jgi:PAS domain-containing protein
MIGSVTRPPEVYFSAKLIAALERVADAVLIANEAAVVTYANAAAQILTGWLHGAALGQPLRSVFLIVHAHTGAMIDGTWIWRGSRASTDRCGARHYWWARHSAL